MHDVFAMISSKADTSHSSTFFFLSRKIKPYLPRFGNLPSDSFAVYLEGGREGEKKEKRDDMGRPHSSAVGIAVLSSV